LTFRVCYLLGSGSIQFCSLLYSFVLFSGLINSRCEGAISLLGRISLLPQSSLEPPGRTQEGAKRRPASSFGFGFVLCRINRPMLGSALANVGLTHWILDSRVELFHSVLICTPYSSELKFIVFTTGLVKEKLIGLLGKLAYNTFEVFYSSSRNG
jgi:hypothetical protein